MSEEQKQTGTSTIEWIKKFYGAAITTSDAYGRAYHLSVLLLVCVQESKRDYENIRNEMLSALGKMTPEQNSKKAWLLGRVLVAAKAMNDQKTVENTQVALRDLLNSPATMKDEYSAWGWGYLANADEAEYKKTKTAMVNAAENETRKYEEAPTKTKDMLSSVLWAWVMNLQAAANASDEETYKEALSQIKSATTEKTLASALSKGIPEGDYQAWAFSITYHAAQKMEDKAICAELKPALDASIYRAEKDGEKSMAEAILAQPKMASSKKEKGRGAEFFGPVSDSPTLPKKPKLEITESSTETATKTLGSPE